MFARRISRSVLSSRGRTRSLGAVPSEDAPRVISKTQSGRMTAVWQFSLPVLPSHEGPYRQNPIIAVAQNGTVRGPSGHANA